MHAATILAPTTRRETLSSRPAPAVGYRALLAAELPALPARTVQLLLAALGILAPVAVSGRFDPATADALRQFQEAAGLDPNGVPGRATADALLARAG
jgi:peptidoglycan hydrolase-like protein with peptidoglycan-binding domain